jgi:hypothetical protein
MRVKGGVDTAKFQAMLLELRRRTGRTIPEVVDEEVAKILGAALAGTKAGKTVARVQAEIANDTRQWRTYNGKKYNVRPATIATRKGKQRATPGKGIRYPNFIWSQIQGLMQQSYARRLAYAKRSRGLGKKQWADLAAQLGMTIKAPRYVGSANPTKYRATTGRRNRLGRYTVDISTNYRNNPFIRSRGALQKAINGRVGFFRKNVKEGVFNDMQAVASKYGARATR